PAQASAADALRGQVLDVLKELLVSGRSDEVIALVQKLVARNEELERLLSKLRSSKNPGEGITREQLDLFLEQLRQTSDGKLAEANEKLEKAALEHGGRPETTKPPKQPALRRPPSPKLRRVDNPIPVPEAERPCPVCGSPRKCITHEITEIVEL